MKRLGSPGRYRTLPETVYHFIVSRKLCIGVTEKVTLKRGKEKYCIQGNPLVYDGAINHCTSSIKDGDDCYVTDITGKVIARGIYNSNSLYRVRTLARSFEGEIHNLPINEVIESRIRDAVELRHLLHLPGEQNTAYRLVNGEGDGLSGLVVDVFHDVVVVQSSALWVEKHRKAIEKALTRAVRLPESSLSPFVRVVWTRMHTRLASDGWVAQDVKENGPVEDFGTSAVTIVEEGIRYRVCPGGGQKTGFYCDQRDNRTIIKKLSAGKHVLDLYASSGGFSLNAIAGGAKSVIAVDSSADALNDMAHNLSLNAFPDLIITSEGLGRPLESPPRISTGPMVNLVRADVEKYLQSQTRQFDVVICDPPKFAVSRQSLLKAREKYIKVNSLVIGAVRPGGLLLTCTCSTLVSSDAGRFSTLLKEAALRAQRNVTVVSEHSAGGDHPLHVAYPEGKHLTVLLVRVS